MRPLPTQGPSFTPLHDMLTAAIPARLLQAGLALGIFNVLGTFRTAGEVAAELDADASNTRLVLDALTNVGLIEKSEGRYQNSALANHYLSPDSKLYLEPLLAMIKRMSIDPLEHLEERIRKGPLLPNARDESGSPCLWVESARASAPWALGEMGTCIARIVSSLPGFSGFKKMLDLGGGHGLFTLYIVQAGETLEGVVFDRAPVIALASEFIASYDMGDSVTVMAGDYLTDDIGHGYDVVWASATLNNAKDNLPALFSKIYDALEPNGYFISLHDGMTGEQTQPAMILEWLGGLLSSGRDLRFEQGEVAEAMLTCGFRSVRSRTLKTPLGQMDLDIAQK
ncbi:O-methyltransferase, family II [Desulfosarcina variabilis str. Montpellier]|uniref:methyltransferase n=1 Tax=Desulfosarcina variabilis TaxID=2300 RepID=UPI003AFAB557